MSINRVVLVGRLTRDPELRTTTTGKSVVNCGLAVDNPYDKDNTNFFNFVAWGKSAEFCANYLSKGRLVAVDGRLQQRKYTTQDGQTREVVEVVADNVQGLDRARDGAAPAGNGGGSGGGGNAPAAAAPSADEFDPFADE
jgi:single-strand DNA-binding protein